MVNVFPDIVHHDTPAGRKASYLYFMLLASAMLAAILYYSISEGQLVKQASSTDSFFNLEMYSGTADCKPWYACLYQKSTGTEPTVSALRCDCSHAAGKLIRMTRNPLFPEVVAQSNWCASAQSLQKYAETLPPLILAATAKAEFANVFNFFSSKASCAAVATATSSSGSAFVSFGGGTESDTIVDHVKAWHLASTYTNVSHQLRLSPGVAPTATTVASWMVQDAYISVDVSPAQAASDAAKTAAGIPFTAKSAVEVTLVNSCSGATGVGGVTAGAELYWPLVIQISTRCQDKLLEADKFQLGMEATYIISSTLLNNQSYTEYHSANRKVILANSFTVAPVPSTGQQSQIQTPQDLALKYARLGTNDYLQGLDNIQIFYPSYSSGYALAYAEYTQTFVLQYYGDMLDQTDYKCTQIGLSRGSPFSGGAANLVEACQLTFTETLKSVFPLTDEARNLSIDKGEATKFRSSVFHPTRTGISSRDASAQAVPITFKSIFGRHTLLSGVNGEPDETGEFEDLMPLNNTGDSINQTKVKWDQSYTNGKYAIHDPYNLKQNTKKRHCPMGNCVPTGLEPFSAYTGWSVKMVSMSASITSLKVIWKHPAITQSDRKLASEQILRKLLESLSASSTSRPQIDVGVSSLSLNSGTIHLAFEAKIPFAQRKYVVGNEETATSGGTLSSSVPWITYTLPYLFQSVDTTTGPNKLAVCEPALVSALQYTDIGGEKGSHPNFPPFPLCRSLGQAVSPAATISFPKFPNPAQAPQGYTKRIEKTIESENEKFQVVATWVSDWTGTITVPDTLVKTVSSGTINGDRTPHMVRALDLLPKAYPLWDRTKVAAENLTEGYSYISPDATQLGQPDFSMYWNACKPSVCQWTALEVRQPSEIILSIVSIAGGIVIACKTVAEQWKNYLKKKKKNVVEIQHNIKVIVAGAQMTTGEVTKEE